MSTYRYLLKSESDTFELGYSIGLKLKPGVILALFGELGTGKTSFTKGVVASFCEIDPLQVHSPTFTYLNIYKGKETIYHFDLYRIYDVDEFFNMGFDEYFFAGGVCCIEWSERIEKFLPKRCVRLYFEHLSEHERKVTIDDCEDLFH